jgi:hypothetical protein
MAFREALIGLSHFVGEEDRDHRVVAGCERPGVERLRDLPRAPLMSGSSEILHWVLVAGALAGLPKRWVDYHPVYRTSAGTSIGLGFDIWSGN